MKRGSGVTLSDLWFLQSFLQAGRHPRGRGIGEGVPFCSAPQLGPPPEGTPCAAADDHFRGRVSGIREPECEVRKVRGPAGRRERGFRARPYTEPAAQRCAGPAAPVPAQALEGPPVAISVWPAETESRGSCSPESPSEQGPRRAGRFSRWPRPATGCPAVSSLSPASARRSRAPRRRACGCEGPLAGGGGSADLGPGRTASGGGVAGGHCRGGCGPPRDRLSRAARADAARGSARKVRQSAAAS
ncbi:PREDICTED: translation initiation factor IF-2-like, partial [Chinchilla lanigera]|uniref:translation initiation factor IF-2-like n=1 Tax=Chinchilla lanigera TaxID=34839 RepID=UPI000697A680